MLLMAHHSNVKANPTEVLPKFQLQNKTFFNTPSWIPHMVSLVWQLLQDQVKDRILFSPIS